MTQIDEVLKECERILDQEGAPQISNDEMLRANLIYRQQIIIAKIKYYLRKLWHFLAG